MWFWRTMYRILFGFRLYFLWSRLYRLVFHSKYDEVPLQSGLGPSAVSHAMSRLTWTKDGIPELGDAVGSPRWVQHCVLTLADGEEQPKGSLDCDEFSVWAATVLDEEYAPRVLNVAWREGFLVSGHHVCVYVRRDGTYHHMGNWGDRGPFVSLREVVGDILLLVRREERDLVGWAIFTPSLELGSLATKLPD